MPIIVSPLESFESRIMDSWIQGRLLPDDLFLVTEQNDCMATAYLIHDIIMDVDAAGLVDAFACRALHYPVKVHLFDDSPCWVERASVNTRTANEMLNGSVWVEVPALNQPGPNAKLNN